jgi:MoxR-like ATPase
MFTQVFHGHGRAPANPVDGAYRTPEPYKPDPNLVKAINLAIFLERPLLLEGEAGCGKSRLAHAVAYELGLPLRVWPVRSTSKARDGLYMYDAVLRLHDVQVDKAGDSTQRQRDPGNPVHYRTFGELGAAFAEHRHRSIVLIDEIDKADLDFPNDLLTVLEPPRHFPIPETNESVTAELAPIVIITSNKEKGNLPKPFLRRCVYFYVKFPEDDLILKDIIKLHHLKRHQEEPQADLLNKAVPLFQEIRKLPLQKPPGTSELLDWVEALHHFGSPNVSDALPSAYEPGKIPYVELLCKLQTDFRMLTTNP